MGTTTALDNAIEGLGYAEADGYVDALGAGHPAPRAFVWRELARKGRLDAAYFRGSVPLVGFARVSSPEDVPELHRRLWNLSRVPLLVVGTDDEVGVYSCFTRPHRDDDASNAKLAAASVQANVPAVLEEFSRFHVETGRVASAYHSYFERNERVDRHLLTNLRAIRAALKSNKHEADAIDVLIGRCMFIRYFEDRGILSPDHIEDLTGRRSLIELLRSGPKTTYKLFSALAERFDGDLFFDDPDRMEALDATDLAALSDFLGATDLPSGQRAFWPYDFSIIPAELISSIYEQLLEETQEQDSAYYTPRHVVDLILDEVLPWNEVASPTILDPACGSGIFLAEAFRRLAFRREGGTSFSALSDLLKSSVFGVDQSPAAITVTAFGLYLAMLEELDPPTVWRDARLPKLIGSNLIVSDFFEDLVFRGSRFDVVVGNPPWTNQFTEAATNFVATNNHPTADNQLAMAFLWKSLDMLADEGRLGLLLPSKQLLHNKGDTALEVRRKVFASIGVETVIDLSILRRDLFQSAKAPAAVLIARRGPISSRTIIHVVPRNTPLQRAIDGFVVSQEDVHEVPHEAATAYPDIWKIYLWGSDEDFGLITRLRAKHPPAREIATKRGWTHRQGFQLGQGGRDATHLTGMRLIESDTIHPFRIVEPSAKSLEHNDMRRTAEGAYEAPHVLIRRTFVQHRPAAVFLNEDAVFPSGVIGVAGPAEDADLLKLLTAYINSSLGAYFQFMTSGSWGVERDALEVNEYMDLPFAEPGPNDVKAIAKIVDRVAASERNDRSWQRDLDRAVFRAYDLTEDEIDLVHASLMIGLDQFTRGSSSAAFHPLTKQDAANYADRITARLRALLPSLQVSTQLAISSPTYAVATTILTKGGLDEAMVRTGAEIIDLLLRQEVSPVAWPSYATIIQPSVVVLDGNLAHLLKPNETRYWTARAAASDAGRLLAAIGFNYQAARS